MQKSVKRSSESGEDKKPVEKITQISRSVGKTSRQIMNQHIHNEHDVITDEDFKNLKIGPDLPGEEVQQPLEIPDDNERPKDEDKDPAIIIPWDLINQ